jgi:hypothetical protein
VISSDPRQQADEMPDTQLFWRWVGKATRPVVGWVLVGVGALMILLGYFGVAHQVLVAKQLPYLVSGGILGVGVIAVGVMFLGTEEIRQDSGRLDRLERMVNELHLALLARPDAPQTTPLDTATAAQPHSTNGTAPTAFIALPTGTIYHLPTCRVVQGKQAAQLVTASTIERRSLAPCALCEPGPVEPAP